MTTTLDTDGRAEYTRHVNDCRKCRLFPVKLCPEGTRLLFAIAHPKPDGER